MQSVLDTSNRAAISTAAEIQLSRDEDSVQSLANLATRDGLITFAGVNSSQAQQNAGRNDHLRSFNIKYPPRKKQKTEKAETSEQGEIKLIGQRSLFKPSSAAKKETYQRLLRLSPAKKRDSGSKRLGALATGMAKENEVIIFDATSSTPDEKDVVARIQLPEGAEAVDLDIAEHQESEFSLVYCTDFTIYEQSYKYDFAAKKVEKLPNGPRRVHQILFPDASERPGSRPKFRSVRFLNEDNIITMLNKPSKAGCELRIFHLYPTGPATQISEKTLPNRMKQAVSMDVCALDQDPQGNQQFALAVAGNDVSIEVYTTNYQRKSATFSQLKQYLTFRDVHPHQMTKICFSPFHSPQRAPDPTPARAGTGKANQGVVADTPNHPGPQYIRLASVTYGNTVVVDTFPLQPLEPKDKNSRYVLSHPSDETFFTVAYISIITLIVLVGAFLIQGFITGFADDQVAGPFSLLPKSMREFLDKPARAARGYGYQYEPAVSSAVETSLPSNMPGKGRLRQLLSRHDASTNEALIVRDAGDSTEGSSSLTVDVHSDKEAYLAQDVHAKHWHELAPEQKVMWKEKLIRAGEWAEGEGEKVLIGLVFSEYAGLVGQAAREALNS